MKVTIMLFGSISVAMIGLAIYMFANKKFRYQLYEVGKHNSLFSSIGLLLFGIAFAIAIPLRVLYLANFELMIIETAFACMWLAPFISIGLGGVIGRFYQPPSEPPKQNTNSKNPILGLTVLAVCLMLMALNCELVESTNIQSVFALLLAFPAMYGLNLFSKIIKNKSYASIC